MMSKITTKYFVFFGIQDQAQIKSYLVHTSLKISDLEILALIGKI